MDCLPPLHTIAKSSSGRLLLVEVVGDFFFSSATCYAALNGRVRPEAVV